MPPTRTPVAATAARPGARAVPGPITAAEAPPDSDPLGFDAPPATQPEKTANITIEIGPAGLTIRAQYTGPLTSIPRSIERLKEEGILDLVRSYAAPPAANGTKRAAAPRVEPAYNERGEAICPTHRKVLKEGRWGFYCPARDESSERGYCSLKFVEE